MVPENHGMNAGGNTLHCLILEQLSSDEPWLLRTNKGFIRGRVGSDDTFTLTSKGNEVLFARIPVWGPGKGLSLKLLQRTAPEWQPSERSSKAEEEIL
jgi:hypothetical protein